MTNMQNNTHRFPLTALSGLEKRPDASSKVSSYTGSVFDQFQLQPSSSSTLNMRGNIIHVAPEGSEVGLPQVVHYTEMSSYPTASVGLSTVLPNLHQPVSQHIPPGIRPSMGENFPQQFSVANQSAVPLQNINPTTAKNFLGELVQALHQAGQLPQNDVFQRLMQLPLAQSQPPDSAPTHFSDRRFRGYGHPTHNEPPNLQVISSRNVEADYQMAQNTEDSQHRHSDGRNYINDAVRMSSEYLPTPEIKSEIIDADYEILSAGIYARYNLQKCSVKLERISIRRDSEGRIVLPKSTLDVKSDVRKMVKVYRAMPLSKRKASQRCVSDYVFADGNATSFPDSMNISLMRNMNEARDHAVRTMYMGPTEDLMQWLTVIWWKKSTQFFCQCVFCPVMAESPKTIVKHIKEDHPELLFALNKKELLGKSFLFINCRHCDFVSVDSVVLWIHMELHHGISGVLDAGLHPDIDQDVKFSLAEISSNEVIAAQSSYVCFDCFKVSTDSRTLALHVLRDHDNTLNYNGCFVKLMMILKPAGDRAVTYNQAISDPDLADLRWDVFVCMLCDLSVKCPYSVLSHSLSCHQNRRLLYTCSECSFNSVSDDRMIEHLNREHDKASRLVCSATVVDKPSSKVVEVPVKHNRKTALGIPQAKSRTGHGKGSRLSNEGDDVNVDVDADTGSSRKKRKPSGVKKSNARVTKRPKAAGTGGSRRTASREKTLQSKSVSSSDVREVEKKFKYDSNCVVRDVDYTITLADETNCESDHENLENLIL